MGIKLHHKLLGVAGVTVLSVLLTACADKSSSHSAQPCFLKDSASSDTPVETLKTLTAEISTVQQQNQQLVAQNKALVEQDKNTLAQFKKDVMTQVEQQMVSAKTALQQTAQTSAARSPSSPKISTSPYVVGASSDAAVAAIGNNGLTWVPDLQDASLDSIEASSKENTASRKRMEVRVNPGLPENTPRQAEKIIATPYYTIPVNATLTGAVAIQPIIGRIPIEGKVPDPYTFKALIGPKNLAANGASL